LQQKLISSDDVTSPNADDPHTPSGLPSPKAGDLYSSPGGKPPMALNFNDRNQISRALRAKEENK